jgi:hypothetical protein
MYWADEEFMTDLVENHERKESYEWYISTEYGNFIKLDLTEAVSEDVECILLARDMVQSQFNIVMTCQVSEKIVSFLTERHVAYQQELRSME